LRGWGLLAGLGGRTARRRGERRRSGVVLVAAAAEQSEGQGKDEQTRLRHGNLLVQAGQFTGAAPSPPDRSAGVVSLHSLRASGLATKRRHETKPGLGRERRRLAPWPAPVGVWPARAPFGQTPSRWHGSTAGNTLGHERPHRDLPQLPQLQVVTP